MAQQLSHLGRGAVRVAKNYTKGYSDTQVKIRGATSNDPWGPSGSQMNEIAQMTYSQNEFVEVMEMLDKRLNDKGKNWRHVFKALTLLDYILHAGSENVVIYFRDNIYIVKTLKEFVYVDDDGQDVGANVRQKAKDITNLLQDEDRLRMERKSRGAMRERMLGNIAESGLRGEDDRGEPERRAERNNNNSGYKPAKTRDEDDDLKRAIEESKRAAMDDESRSRARNQEEDDLRKAIAMSEEEEAKRRRQLEESNATALFDDGLQMQPSQNLVDVGWNQQQQPLQPQYTSFNPFMQQQMMQQQQQQQQQEEYMRQQMMMAEQERQRQEWMQMQQQQQQQQQMMMQQQQQLMAQPTGYRSNNPFAPGGGGPSMSLIPESSPMPAPTPQAQPQIDFFQPAPQPAPQQQPERQGGFAVKTKDTNPELAALWANREGGLDTFGNVGSLRIPVGSVFHESNRQAVQQGLGGGFGNTNPFARQQQQQQQQGQQQGAEQPFFQI